MARAVGTPLCLAGRDEKASEFSLRAGKPRVDMVARFQWISP